MGVAFRNKSTATGTGTVVLTDPGQPGDLLIAFVISDTNGVVWTKPDATWTQLDTASTTVDTQTYTIFYKKSGTGSGSYTFDSGNALEAVGIMIAYSGADPNNPININGKTVDDTSQASPVSISAPSVTTTLKNCVLLWLAGVDPVAAGTTTYTVPGGYTSRATVDNNSFDSAVIAEKALSAAGATGSATGSATTAGNAADAGFHVAIAPPAQPTITQQPTNQLYGPQTGSVTFTVAATAGSGSLTYQWRRNGVTIGGATSSSYTFVATYYDEGASIDCVVTDDNGSTTSSAAQPAMNPGGLDVFLYPSFPVQSDVVLSDPTQIRSFWDVSLPWSPGRAQLGPPRYASGDPMPRVANAVVLTATGFETATAPNRAQLGPPRYALGEPLGAVVIAQSTPGGFDASPASARTAHAPLMPAGDPVAAPRAAVVLFDAAAAGGRAARAPQPTGSDPATPSAQPGAGISVTPAWARPQGPRVFTPGEPTTPSAVSGAGISVTPAWARPPGARIFLPGEPIPATFVTAAGFNVSAALARLLGPRVFVSGEPPPPQVSPGAGITVSPAWARPPGPRVFVSGEATRTLVLAAISAWGYEPAWAPGRVSQPLRAGAPGEPLPKLILPAPATIDQSAPTARLERRRLSFSADPIAGAVANWGWEPAAPGSRIVRPAAIATGEPVAVAPAILAMGTAAAASARAARAEKPSSTDGLALLALAPVGFEPRAAIGRAGAARAYGDSGGPSALAPPAAAAGWETGAALMRAGRSPILQATIEAFVAMNQVHVLIFTRVGAGGTGVSVSSTKTEIAVSPTQSGIVIEGTQTSISGLQFMTSLTLNSNKPTET